MNSERRKYARFQQNDTIVVELYLDLSASQRINSVKGLMINESLGGCKLVVVSHHSLAVNTPCLIKFQGFKLEPVSAKITWLKFIEENVFLLGLDYLVNL